MCLAQSYSTATLSWHATPLQVTACFPDRPIIRLGVVIWELSCQGATTRPPAVKVQRSPVIVTGHWAPDGQLVLLSRLRLGGSVFTPWQLRADSTPTFQCNLSTLNRRTLSCWTGTTSSGTNVPRPERAVERIPTSTLNTL